MLSASKPKCNFCHQSEITLKSSSYLLPKFSRVPLTITLVLLISTTVNSTLLNFGKRYEDELRVIFDCWQKLRLGLDALSNKKILKGIYYISTRMARWRKIQINCHQYIINSLTNSTLLANFLDIYIIYLCPFDTFLWSCRALSTYLHSNAKIYDRD